jgi:hypothetical protein
MDAQRGKDVGCSLSIPATDHEVPAGVLEGRELYPDLGAVAMNPDDADSPPLSAHLNEAIVQVGKPQILGRP